ncbi:hypothetical protein S2E19_01715 [Bacillus mycoides]|nr:hypothetical protein S2E19_01715 [Bacillus mycoides]
MDAAVQRGKFGLSMILLSGQSLHIHTDSGKQHDPTLY